VRPRTIRGRGVVRPRMTWRALAHENGSSPRAVARAVCVPLRAPWPGRR